MKVKILSLYFKNFKKIFWFKHKRRKKKRRKKKHLHLLFLSRKKKFINYYLQFDSKKIKKDNKLGFNPFLSQFNKKNKIGIKSLKYCLISGKPLKSLKFVTEKYLRAEKYTKRKKKPLKLSLKAFPDYWLTSKSKGIRMGKGKGGLKKKIFFLKKGSLICTIKFKKKFKKKIFNKKFLIFKISLFIALLLKRLKNKMPMFCTHSFKKF